MTIGEAEAEAEAVTAIDESEAVTNTDKEVVTPAEDRVTILRVRNEDEVELETSKNVGIGDSVTDATSRDSISTSADDSETLHEADINKLIMPLLKYYLKRTKKSRSHGNK